MWVDSDVMSELTLLSTMPAAPASGEKPEQAQDAPVIDLQVHRMIKF